jgi:hypothetical protein
MTQSIQIGSRFQGPPSSGNGGYTCGMLGKHIRGPATVRLNIPPPLNMEMDIRRTEDCLKLYSGEDMVASARPTVIDIEIPSPPDFKGAIAASRRFRWFDSHFYPGCFVCGPAREKGDGLRIFAGPVDSSDGPEGLVAANWTPDDSLADSTGCIADEFIWAALDCPGAYSFAEPADGTILLGELAVSIKDKVSPGEECVLIGWEIKQEGRKHFTGTALFNEPGRCCAVGYATWFEVPV